MLIDKESLAKNLNNLNLSQKEEEKQQEKTFNICSILPWHRKFYCFKKHVHTYAQAANNMEVLQYKFFYKNIFYKKVSLKNPKTLRKCLENLQPQLPGLNFLKTLIFARAL